MPINIIFLLCLFKIKWFQYKKLRNAHRSVDFPSDIFDF